MQEQHKPQCSLFLSGYRHFPLFDKNGEQFEQGVVFVHIKIDDPPQ